MKKLNCKILKNFYYRQKPEIVNRLNEFKGVWKTSDSKQLFAELCFCLLTPQSKAKNCWNAVLKLKNRNLLFHNNLKQIEECLTGVRFRRKKAEYVISARKLFPELIATIRNHKSINDLRLWLVKNVTGMGFKEASHFLRNIGLGENLAILDRHVLKNLKALGVIKKYPNSLTNKSYIEIENKLKSFSEKVEIPVAHLDLLFWSKETGEIFK